MEQYIIRLHINKRHNYRHIDVLYFQYNMMQELLSPKYYSREYKKIEKVEINNECKQNGLIIVRVKLNTGTNLILNSASVKMI